MKYQSHESFQHGNKPVLGSNRNFGFVFTVFFLILGLLPYFIEQKVNIYLLACSGIILLISIFSPKLLYIFNLIWFFIGVGIGKLTTPVVIGVLYFLFVVPMGVFMQLFKRNWYEKGFDDTKSSYWVKCSAADNLTRENLHKQY